jgi:hypothetical protein
MTETLKVLGQVAPLATTETDLYEVPRGKQAVTSTLVIVNRSAGALTYRVSVSVAGAATATKDYLYYDVSQAANSSSVVRVALTLSSLDEVRVYASSADMSFSLFGTELS